MGLCNRFFFKVSLLVIATVGFGGVGIGIFGLTQGAVGSFSIGQAAAPLALITGGVLFVTAGIGYKAVQGLDTKRVWLTKFLILLTVTLSVYLIAAAFALSAASGMPNCDSSKDICQDMPPEVESNLKTVWFNMPVDIRAQLKVTLNCGSAADEARVKANRASAISFLDDLKTKGSSVVEKGKEISSGYADKASAQFSSLTSKFGNSTAGSFLSDLSLTVNGAVSQFQNSTFVSGLASKIDAQLVALQNTTKLLADGYNMTQINELRVSLRATKLQLQSSLNSTLFTGNGTSSTNSTSGNSTRGLSEEEGFQACKNNLAKLMRGNMQIIGGALGGFAVILMIAASAGFSICCSKDEVEQINQDDW
jgi:hypothetical protein